ncbi:hypothetical protein NFI96_004773 [Prochilodus magdalenae]|nr:hypothetical protein NFI96_004773 [Prochilodus magdalenae]
MDSLKPQEHLRLTGNVDGNWRTVKQQLLLYVSATGLDAKPDTRKIAVLLTVAGLQAIEIYSTFVFGEEPWNISLKEFVYIDDMIIWGSSLQEHNERLIKVLKSIRKNGLKLNKSKCQFAVQEIIFLGDKLTALGIQPDQEKVSDILNMSRPLDKKLNASWG